MLEKRRILFVEDDLFEIQSISGLLRHLRMDFVHTSTVGAALEALGTQTFDFVLTDLHIETKAGLETPDGLMVIKVAKEQQPNLTIVATSSDPRTEIVNAALAIGAHHFIRKPLSKSDEIVIALRLASERKLLAWESEKSSKSAAPKGHWENFAAAYPYGIVLGEREHRLARLVAKKRASCVITGETGTGKEEVAKIIHRMRCEEGTKVPFVAVNCATITGGLSESLLFGHRKGAFTGADDSTIGYIGEADGGILFLDEIQNLSISVQQKLLRVLNDGTYHRLGETKLHRSQFQLVAASTKDLDIEVREGRFLLDIRTRMMGLDLFIPPLRERKSEMAALVALFLSSRNIYLGSANFDQLVLKLQGFDWTGNIRQLFKSLQVWLLTCELDGLPLTAEHFPIFKDLAKLPAPEPRQPSRADLVDFNQAIHEDRDFEELVGEFEKAILRNALDRHQVISQAARCLNLPRSTIDSKRRKYDL